MNLKNAVVFYYLSDSAFDVESLLSDAVAEHPISEIGPLELSRTGFAKVDGDDFHLSANANGGTFTKYHLDVISKILPNSAINDEVAKRVQRIAEADGRKVGGRERKKIKEDVVREFLPRAFSKRARIEILIDEEGRRVIVGTASSKVAEGVITAIREALGSFPVALPITEDSPREIMTGWLATGDLPSRFTLGNEVALKDPVASSGATWRARNEDLESEEVKEHLRSGKRVQQIGLIYNDRIYLVLDEALTIRKLKLLDTALEDLEDEGERADYERASVALYGGELADLLEYIEATFSVRKPG